MKEEIEEHREMCELKFAIADYMLTAVMCINILALVFTIVVHILGILK